MDMANIPSSSSRPGRGRGNWKKYVLVAVVAMVVMTAGAVIGAGAAVLYFGRMFLHHPSTPEQATRLITSRLSASAALSPEEQARTNALVEKQMAEVAAIRKRYEEEIAGKLGNISDGISEIIGPERARGCGAWMHRYHGRGDAGRNSQKKKCVNCVGGAECGVEAGGGK